MRKQVTALVVLGVALFPSLAEGRCTQLRKLLRFSLSASLALRCEDRDLGLSRGRCRELSPPECSENALERLVDLAYGAAPDRRTHPWTAQARCQRAISRGIARYVWRRIPGRSFGRRSVPRPSRLIEGIERSCAGVDLLLGPSGRLPAFSGACSDLATDSGTLDERDLARCLRASVEAIIDDIAPAPLRPNIILILTDDQRWDTLEYMPNVLETLADRGIRFSNGFVTSPTCAPSRASILSGSYAHNHGILDNDQLLTGGYTFDHADSVGRWLSAVDYRTAFFGKYMNRPLALQLQIPDGWDEWRIFLWSGFYDYWLQENEEVVGVRPQEDLYSTDYLKDQAVAFIEENREHPFFFVVSPFAAHAPATAADRHLGTFADLPLWRPPNFREPDTSLKPLWVRFKQWVQAGRTPVTDRLRIKQLESLLAVDEAVRDISHTLEELGLTDHTLVVFTSDNGYLWGEHWGNAKFSGYEESIRVPYLVRYPLRYPIPEEREAMVLNIDLAPTFAALAGAAVPPGVDGESLLPVLDGAVQGRDDFMFENFTDFVVRPHAGVRTRRWKYIRTYQGPDHNAFEEVYDLESDPYELDNLAYSPAYAEILTELVERLEELQSE